MSVHPTDSQPQTVSTSSSQPQTSVAMPTGGKPATGTVNAARKKFEEMTRPAALQTRSSSFRELREKTQVPPRNLRMRAVTVKEVNSKKKPPRPPRHKTVTGTEAERVASAAVAQFEREKPPAPPRRTRHTVTGSEAQHAASEAVAELKKEEIKKPHRPLPPLPSDSAGSSSEVTLPDSFYHELPKTDVLNFLSIRELCKKCLGTKQKGMRAFKVRMELTKRILEKITSTRGKVDAWLDPENKGKKFVELAPRSKRAEVQSYSPAGSANSTENFYTRYLAFAKADLEKGELEQFLEHAIQAQEEASKMTHSHQKIEAYCEITKLVGKKYPMIAKQHIKECLELSESLSPREQLISLCKIAQVQMEFDILGPSETIIKAKKIALGLPFKTLDGSLQPLDQLELYASTFTLLRNPYALKPIVDDGSNFRLDTHYPKLAGITSTKEKKSELEKCKAKAAKFEEVGHPSDRSALVDQLHIYVNIALIESEIDPKKAKQTLSRCEKILWKIASIEAVPSSDLIKEIETHCRLTSLKMPLEAKESLGRCEQFVNQFLAEPCKEVREKIAAEKIANGNVPSPDLIKEIEVYCQLAGRRLPYEAKNTLEKCEQFVNQLSLAFYNDLAKKIEANKLAWLLLTKNEQILHHALLEQVEVYCQLASNEKPDEAKETLRACEQFIYRLPEELRFSAFSRLALFEASVDLEKAKETPSRCEKFIEKAAEKNVPSHFLIAQVEAYYLLAGITMPNEAVNTLEQFRQSIDRFFVSRQKEMLEKIAKEKEVLPEKAVSPSLIAKIEACCRVEDVQMSNKIKESLNQCYQFVNQFFSNKIKHIEKNSNEDGPSHILIAQIESYCRIVGVEIPEGFKESLETCRVCFGKLQEEMLRKICAEHIPSTALIQQVEAYCRIARVNIPEGTKESFKKCEEFIKEFFEGLQKEILGRVVEEKRIPKETFSCKSLVDQVETYSHIALAVSQKKPKEAKKTLARCERIVEMLATENVPSPGLIHQIEACGRIAAIEVPIEAKKTLGKFEEFVDELSVRLRKKIIARIEEEKKISEVRKATEGNIPSHILIETIEAYSRVLGIEFPNGTKKTFEKCEAFIDRLSVKFRHKMREKIAEERMMPNGMLSMPCLIKLVEAYSRIALSESDLEPSTAKKTLLRCKNILRRLPKENIPKKCLTELLEAYHRLASTEVPDKAKETLKESELWVVQLPIELRFKTFCRIALFESDVKPTRALETLGLCDALLPDGFTVEQIEAYCRIVGSERIPGTTAKTILEKCVQRVDRLPLDFQFAAYCRIALLAAKHHPEIARTTLERCCNEKLGQKANDQITPHQSIFQIVAYCMIALSKSREEATKTLALCKALAQKLPPEEQVVAYSKIGLIETMVDSEGAKKTFAVRESLLKDLAVFAGRSELQMMDQIIAYCKVVDFEGEADHELAKDLLAKCDEIGTNLDSPTRRFALYEIQGREHAIKQRLLDQVEALCKLAKIEEKYDLGAAIATLEKSKEIARKLPLKDQIAAYYSIANSASSFDRTYTFRIFDEIKRIVEGRNIVAEESRHVRKDLAAWEKIDMFCMIAQLQSTLDIKKAKETLMDCKRLRREANAPFNWQLRISMVRRVAKMLAHFDVDEALQILKDEELLLRSKAPVYQMQLRDAENVINLIDQFKTILEISDVTIKSKEIKGFCGKYGSIIESLSPSVKIAYHNLLQFLDVFHQEVDQLESVQGEISRLDELGGRFKDQQSELKEKQERVQAQLNRQFESVRSVLESQMFVQKLLDRQKAIHLQLKELDTFQHELARLTFVQKELDRLEETHRKLVKGKQKAKESEEDKKALVRLKAVHQKKLNEKQRAILKAQYQLEGFYKVLSSQFESTRIEFEQLFKDEQKSVQKLSDQLDAVRKELDQFNPVYQEELKDKHKAAQKLFKVQKKILASLQNGAEILKGLVQEGFLAHKKVVQIEEESISIRRKNIETSQKEVEEELRELDKLKMRFTVEVQRFQKKKSSEKEAKERFAKAEQVLTSLKEQQTDVQEALKGLVKPVEKLVDITTTIKCFIAVSYKKNKDHYAYDFQRSKEMIIEMRVEIEQQQSLSKGSFTPEEAKEEQAIAMKLQEAVSGLSTLKEFIGWLSPLTSRQRVHVFLDIAEIELLLNSSIAQQTLKEAEKFAMGMPLQDRKLALEDINQTKRKFLKSPKPELLPVVPYLKTYHVEADECVTTRERRKSLSSKAKRLSMRFFRMGGN